MKTGTARRFYILSLISRYIFEAEQECGELFYINRLVNLFGCWRIFDELIFWPYRAMYKATAAVGAYIVQHICHTGGTEGAFVGADHGLLRVRWQ